MTNPLERKKKQKDDDDECMKSKIPTPIVQEQQFTILPKWYMNGKEDSEIQEFQVKDSKGRWSQSFQLSIDYKPIRIIGEGSFGVVCSAINTKSGEKVAIKKMEGKDLYQLRLISREIQILMHLRNHKSIVELKDILIPGYLISPGKWEFDTIHLVYQLIHSNLFEVRQSEQWKHLRHKDYRLLLVQLLMGLKDIHRANILHRDLKPDNLLVDKFLNVKICDFGLSRAITTSKEKCPIVEKEMTQWIGTNGYRAPEIMLNCKRYGKPADIWSVGCIFAELVNKEQLFKGNPHEYHDFYEVVSTFGSAVIGDLDFIDNEEGLTKAEAAKGKKTVTVPFTDIFPSLRSHPDALDLMKNLLAFDPRVRITAEAALEHPYLKEVFEDYSDIEGYSNNYTELVQSQGEESLDTVKGNIWRHMKLFH